MSWIWFQLKLVKRIWQNTHLVHILVCSWIGNVTCATTCGVCDRIPSSLHGNLSFGALCFLGEHLECHLCSFAWSKASWVWMLGWLHLQCFKVHQHWHHPYVGMCSIMSHVSVQYYFQESNLSMHIKFTCMFLQEGKPIHCCFQCNLRPPDIGRFR